MQGNKAFIKEIFESVQGEGIYIGVNQLFIRFTECNLHCNYCDTDFKTNTREYTANELLTEINKYKNVHSVSLTGGEPLTQTAFLKELLPNTDKKIYLETNGTLYKNLAEIIDYVDIISMDVKLPSSTGMKDLFDVHKKFIETAKGKELFLKAVFDEKITEQEIEKTIDLAVKYNLTIILQPKTDGEFLKLPSDTIYSVFNKFVTRYPDTRLIPQVHKFLNIR